MFCKTCGAEMPENAHICTQCRNNPSAEPAEESQTLHEVYVPCEQTGRSRIIAGVLQIVLGCFGAGRLYLGYFWIAVLQCFLTVTTFGILIIWPIIDGVLILKGWVKRDAYGVPLRD